MWELKSWWQKTIYIIGWIYAVVWIFVFIASALVGFSSY